MVIRPDYIQAIRPFIDHCRCEEMRQVHYF